MTVDWCDMHSCEQQGTILEKAATQGCFFYVFPVHLLTRPKSHLSRQTLDDKNSQQTEHLLYKVVVDI